MPTSTPRERRNAKLIGLIGVLAVTAYAALGALQILVLNPLAAVPGATLEEIHADMAAMNESINVFFVLGFMGLGVGLSILVALLARRPDSTPVSVAGGVLALLMSGAPAYFIASFGPGMALADAFGISGADYAPWGVVLYLVSFLAACALIAMLVVTAARGHASTPVTT